MESIKKGKSKNCATDGPGIGYIDRLFGSFMSCLTDDERSIFEKVGVLQTFLLATQLLKKMTTKLPCFCLSGTVSVLNYTISGRAITHDAMSGDL